MCCSRRCMAVMAQWLSAAWNTASGTSELLSQSLGPWRCMGTCTIDQVCDLCAQDELPGCPVQKDDTRWPTTIAVNLAHYVAGWFRFGETATKQTGDGAMAVTF